MNSHSGTKDNNIRRTKATAAIPMAGAIVTAALLLSGLSLITSYQPVIAQENMTGGGGATTTDNATSTMGGNATTATNASESPGGGANRSMSDVRTNIEQARMALQNNDTQGARMYLDMALGALGGGTQSNMTSTTGGMTNATTGGGILGGNQSAGGILGGGGITDGGGGGGGGGTTDGGGGGGPLAGIFGG